ncbi:phage tail tape measure protein [Lactobacillus gasseri]|uniref:phage tail tape measure protein n=1 Tax=Lactobacillus gasseri TaxID=1596 RepID=UPI00166D8765|nr:phage tail tape measure protein [Lactobacillus gasseri]MBD0888719.1 phage tail tape measure protein [Lactobacillus gasseri]
MTGSEENLGIKAILSAVDQGFTAGLDAAAARAQTFGELTNNAFKGIGTGMMVAGTAITAMGVSSIKSFGQFEASLNQAAVVAGGTAKDIGQLDDLANKMGADLPLSAQDCADAMIEMARNGASIGDIKKQFPAIAQAATAAGADIKATAGVVQEAMNIWGKSLDSPQQAAAILVQTANASNASVEDMQQALATIGGSAGQAGMSLQVTSEAIGLLTNKGFSAAQASMDLNHAILQMMAPSKVASDAMASLGISFTDAQGKMKKFPDILRELNQALDGLNPSEKAQKLKAMFGTAGMQAIVPLLDTVKNKTNDAKVSWDAYAREQDKAAGSTKKANQSLKDQANEMQKNVGSSIEQLGGNWEALRNKSMKSAQDINGSLIQNANEVMQWATTSNSGVAQFTRGFIGLSPGVGAATVAVGGFLRSAGDINKSLGKGITGLSNLGKTTQIVAQGLKNGHSAAEIAKDGLSALSKNSLIAATAQKALATAAFIAQHAMAFGIVGAIVIVVTALTLFFTKTKTGQQMWANFIAWLKNAWNGLSQAATKLWQSVLKSLQPIIKQLQALWKQFQVFFTAMWNLLRPVVMPVFNFIRQYITTVMKNIMTVIKTMMNIIKIAFSTGWNALTIIVRTVWNIIRTIISTSLSVITGLLKAGTALMRGDWSGAWNAIKGVASSIWNGITSIINTAMNGLVNIVRTMMNGMKNVFSSIWNGIKQIFQNNINFIKSVTHIDLGAQGRAIMDSFLNGLKGAWENVKSFVGGIGNWIKEHKGPLSYDEQLLIPAGQAIMSGLNGGLTTGFSDIQDNVSGMAGVISGQVTGIMDKAQNALNDNQLTIPPINSQQYSESIDRLNGMVQGGNYNQNVTMLESGLQKTNTELLRKIANKDNTMILDDGTLVAKTAPQYDKTIGGKINLKDRWSK